MQDKDTTQNQDFRKSIIILSEFQEGTWESVCFSLKHLTTTDHSLVLVQTYQKPNIGQSLLNNIVPVLERVAKNELQEIKNRAIENKLLTDQQLSIHPHEGEFASFVRYKQKSFNPECLVVSLKHPFTENLPSLVSRICKLASNTSKPLFVLPYHTADNTFSRILYLSDNNQSFQAKNDFLKQLPLSDHAIIDFRWVSRKAEEHKNEKAQEKIHHLFGDRVLKPGTTGMIRTKEDPAALSEQLRPDLIIIDQSLIIPCSRFKKLKLKNWIEFNPNIPFLIL